MLRLMFHSHHAFGFGHLGRSVARLCYFRRRGVVRMVHPADLTPEHPLVVVHDLLGDPHPLEPPFALDGLPSAAAELEELLGDCAWGRVSSTRATLRRKELRLAGSGRPT